MQQYILYVHVFELNITITIISTSSCAAELEVVEKKTKVLY